MLKNVRNSTVAAVGAAIVLTGSTLAWAGAHTWRVNEIFSDSTGQIQFMEFKECCGGNFETGFANNNITSTAHSFNVPGGALVSPTGLKHILIATPAFAELPGVPTPDYVLPAGMVPFFALAGDSVAYFPYSTLTFGAGALPTDGVHSLNLNLTTGCNSPTNYAGATGHINLACPLKGDVDGNVVLDGLDIAGFVRVLTGTPLPSDNAACTEYCTGSVAGNVTAFVNDLL